MKYRILALHGKWENGEEFRQRLGPLQEALGEGREVEWVFLTAPFAAADGRGGFEWWSLPPGVRSFQAKEYIGFEESVVLIEDAWKKQGPFDAVMGFSQGAILLSVLLARGLAGKSIVTPSRAILFGAAWPNPYGDTVNGLKSFDAELSASPLRVLHVYSLADPMNPGAMAREVAECFGPASESLVYDEAKHTVPQDSEHLRRYKDFLGL